MNQYYCEIIRIGNKFNLDSNITKIIFDYNKNTYPNHYEIELKNEYNVPLKLKYCIPGKIFFQNECTYCNILIKCNKCYMSFKRSINHNYCIDCDRCVDDNNLHNICNHCNLCHNINHGYCIECNVCYYDNLHKYHNPEIIFNRNDMLNQIKFHFKIHLDLQGIARNENLMILIRLSVKFCQLFPNYRLANQTNNKITTFIESGLLMINQEILLTKYKKILEKYI
jgi:hypothetical protein